MRSPWGLATACGSCRATGGTGAAPAGACARGAPEHAAAEARNTDPRIGRSGQASVRIGEKYRGPPRRGTGRGDDRRRDQALKLEPQPQVVVAFGLLNTKPRPMISSLKSMVVPLRYR